VAAWEAVVAHGRGIEQVLAQLGVKSIWPNEVDFSRLDDVEEFQEDLDEEEEDAEGGAEGGKTVNDSDENLFNDV
jgi:hypothetical protein